MDIILDLVKNFRMSSNDLSTVISNAQMFGDELAQFYGFGQQEDGENPVALDKVRHFAYFHHFAGSQQPASHRGSQEDR